MSVLVYVESPYQLENAIKYLLDGNKSEGFRVIIRDNSNETQLSQMKSLISNSGLIDVSFIKLTGGGLMRLLLYPFVLLRVLYKGVFSTTVIIGDARSIVAFPLIKLAEVFNRRIVLVDDGLYLLSYIKNIFRKKYTVYTRLPLGALIEKNSMSLIFKPCEITKAPCKADFSGQVNFIGMKISEIGFVTEKFYIEYLKKILQKFNGHSFNYYAHRGESLDKLRIIEKIGYKVITPSISIEKYLIDKGAYKGIYVTFFSTALYNLSMMVSCGEFYFIRVRGGEFFHLQTSNVLECYKLFSTAGLKELNI